MNNVGRCTWLQTQTMGCDGIMGILVPCNYKNTQNGQFWSLYNYKNTETSQHKKSLVPLQL